MAEKRRLSTRERREPAAKRRVSEATTRASSPAQSQQTTRRKGSTPAAASSPTATPNPPPEVIESPLPTKVKDGEPLPTRPTAQPADLSLKEYQSIAESAVLLVSLERSKKKWLSDGILERYWTKPKKTKRDQLEGKNPPKESMSKVGPCNIVVGPHLFDAMLYTVKDPNAPPPVQYTPTQRPMVHYGHPNNFQQYHPYPQAPHAAQNQRPHPSHPSHATPPQQAHQQAHRPPPPQPARTPSNHTPQRPPGPQSAQRPPANQNPPPQQPPKPNPDPVIQMLATRAAQDPELKALMRLVASTNATQEQLRTFQAHIDELNAIIRAREQQQRRQQQQQQQTSQPPIPTPARPSPRPSEPATQAPQQPSSQAPPQPPPATAQQPPSQRVQQSSTPQPQPQPQPQSTPQSRPRVEVQIPKPPQTGPTPQIPGADTQSRQPPAPQHTPATPQIKQEAGVGTIAPAPTTRVSSPSVAPGAQQGPPTNSIPPPPQQQQAMGQRPGPQYQYQQPPYQAQPLQSRPPQYGSPAQYYRATPPRPPPPPKLNYKSVVFEFTSPLTPYGSSTSGHAGSGDRYLFPENTILEWLPGGTTVLASFLLVRKVDPNVPFPIETNQDNATSRAKGKSASKSKKADKNKDKAGDAQKDKDKAADGADVKQGDSNGQPGKTDEKADQKASQSTDANKSTPDANSTEDKKPTNLKEYYQPITFRIFSSNPKTLEPLARVVKPQEEVRKYMNEIMDRAERAPDGFLTYQLPREQPIEDLESEYESKKGGTPVPFVNGRSKLSRGRTIGEDSEAENADGLVEDEEEEEELKDFYGPPTGLVPLGI